MPGGEACAGAGCAGAALFGCPLVIGCVDIDPGDDVLAAGCGCAVFAGCFCVVVCVAFGAVAAGVGLCVVSDDCCLYTVASPGAPLWFLSVCPAISCAAH